MLGRADETLGPAALFSSSAERERMKLNRYVVIAVVLGAVVLAGAGFAFWKQRQASALPEGIFGINGRVEATQVDIATKIAGRVIEIKFREGDMVALGDVYALLDKEEIEAQLRQSEAQAELARRTLAKAEADAEARNADLILAQQNLRRTATLLQQGWETREKLDQRTQQLNSAIAALAASKAQIEEAKANVRAADANVNKLRANLNDTTIKSPVRGRVQYRLIEPGAVLSAGGRIATVVDLTDVYMTIFAPADVAGQLTIGSEARIVVDAAPEFVFPATVSFVAPESQFTPKSVETQSEREQLYFRVKLQAPPGLLKDIEDRVKAGLRGTGYVKVDPAATWPERLAIKVPDA